MAKQFTFRMGNDTFSFFPRIKCLMLKEDGQQTLRETFKGVSSLSYCLRIAEAITRHKENVKKALPIDLSALTNNNQTGETQWIR